MAGYQTLKKTLRVKSHHKPIEPASLTERGKRKSYISPHIFVTAVIIQKRTIQIPEPFDT
jgi:hypothetical protein